MLLGQMRRKYFTTSQCVAVKSFCCLSVNSSFAFAQILQKLLTEGKTNC